MYTRRAAAVFQAEFPVRCGTLVRIAGPNGTGKTSLLRLLVGLMQPQEGQILWKNEPIKKLKKSSGKISFTSGT